MNIIMYVGVILALGLIRWEQKKLHIRSFLKEVIVVCIMIFFLQLIASQFNISFSLLSENLEIWIGGTLIFLVACLLAFRGWRKANS